MNQKTLEAARALVDALDRTEADPKFRAVWEFNQKHNGPYDGVRFEAELKRLKKCLNEHLPPPLEAVSICTACNRVKIGIGSYDTTNHFCTPGCVGYMNDPKPS